MKIWIEKDEDTKLKFWQIRKFWQYRNFWHHVIPFLLIWDAIKELLGKSKK